MQKKYFISFLVMIAFLAAGTRGEAFVPQTPHLLHLVMKKIRVPAGMTITQTRKIGAQTESEAFVDRAVPEVSIEETLTYLLPERLRSDLKVGIGKQFYVMSGTGFVKVLNGEVTDLERSPGEYYTDPLLYRDHEIFSKVLADAGINVDKVSLQRLDGTICWFIGEPTFDKSEGDGPGLWIGKDSFFPVRYLIQKSGRSIDIRYDEWHRVSRSWYPKHTQIFVDGELFARIFVDRMVLTPGLSRNLFDVDKILRRYPRKVEAETGDGGHDAGLKDLDQEIETFNKLYD